MHLPPKFPCRSAIANAVAVQDDGKIVVAGTETAGVFDNGDFLIRRYTANGSPDPTFSGDGSETIDFDAYADAAFDLAIADNGKIVAVGYASSDTGLSKTQAAVVRLRPDGAPDSTFSGDGKRVLSGVGQAQAVVLQDDGKIVVGGSGPDGSSIGFALARLDDAGKLDPSFPPRSPKRPHSLTPHPSPALCRAPVPKTARPNS